MPDADLDKQLSNLLIAATGPSPDRAQRVRELVTQGADVHTLDVGRTPLHWAARAGDKASVEVLLELGADPARTTPDGVTALHDAVWVGAEDDTAEACVRALLAAGASATATNASGALPLHEAAENGLAGAVERLGPRSPLDQPNAAGSSALRLSIVQGNWPVVQRLLTLGAKVDADCLAEARSAPKRMKALLTSAHERRAPVASRFDRFAACLAAHLDDGPATDAELSSAQARALLDRLSARLGVEVAQGLDTNTDVDHFEEECGDDWLDALLQSYWEDAHAQTLEAAWNTLPADTRAALPSLEALAPLWCERYRTAALAAAGDDEVSGDDA